MSENDGKANAKPAVHQEDAGKKAGDGPRKPAAAAPRPREIGGPKGPEPTRYGDWERKGRVSDF